MFAINEEEREKRKRKKKSGEERQKERKVENDQWKRDKVWLKQV